MEQNLILLEELKQSWRMLCLEIQKNNHLKTDLFESAFSETYALLTKKSTETTLDKQYVELVAEAFLFANIKDDTLDCVCQAACILTERMLSCCAFSSAATIVDSAVVYIFEARKNVLLDFTNVQASVDKLAQTYETVYWKKKIHNPVIL